LLSLLWYISTSTIFLLTNFIFIIIHILLSLHSYISLLVSKFYIHLNIYRSRNYTSISFPRMNGDCTLFNMLCVQGPISHHLQGGSGLLMVFKVIFSTCFVLIVCDMEAFMQIYGNQIFRVKLYDLCSGSRL